MKNASLWLAVCAVALFCGVTAAHAFTVESYANTGSGQHLADPDDEDAPIQHLTQPDGGSSGQSLNFLGGKLNFSASGSGQQQGGGNSAFGIRNYNDPSIPPAPSPEFSDGPFGMFGPRR